MRMQYFQSTIRVLLVRVTAATAACRFPDIRPRVAHCVVFGDKLSVGIHLSNLKLRIIQYSIVEHTV